MAGEYLEVSERIWSGFFCDDQTVLETSKNLRAHAIIYGLIAGGTLDPEYAAEDIIGWARSFAVARKDEETLNFLYGVARDLNGFYDTKRTRDALTVCGEYIVTLTTLNKFLDIKHEESEEEKKDKEGRAKVLKKLRGKSEANSTS